MKSILGSRFRKVVCGVSGGVDSTVAAYLLKRKGFEVLGVYMRNWDVLDEKGICTSDQDCEDAEYVCKKIGIPFMEVNFVKDYWNSVFSNFVDAYQNGVTPNPDILCNKHIKFDVFFNYAKHRLEADAIATGHYVRTSFGPYLENYNPKLGAKLMKGVELIKDQSFFLAQIPQRALQQSMFPVGGFMKPQVRRLAEKIGLNKIARKKESMGICFIGSHNFQQFINEYIDPKPGNIVNIEDGKILGRHNGIHMWTIGQRCRYPFGKYKYYVVDKNLQTNDIIVAPGNHHPSLYSCSLITKKPYWIHEPPAIPMEKFSCSFRFQHTNPVVNCTATELANENLQVILEHPLRALTPGQFAVFYEGDICLGSTEILEIGPSLYFDSSKNR